MREPMGAGTAAWRFLRLAERHVLAQDVHALVLATEDGAALPEPAPGAHIEIEVPGGVRAYSLCSPPGLSGRYQIAVHDAPGGSGGARHLCRVHPVGGLLRVRGPRNAFPLAAGHARVRLIAGGIGITPIVAMADHLARNATPFTLHYAARSRAAAAFADRLAQSGYASRVRTYFRDDPGAPRLDLPRLLGELQPDEHVYLCGPGRMLNDALAVGERLGIAHRLHHERFGRSEPVPAAAVHRSFDVIAARSGVRVTVSPECSIAEALQRVGIDLGMSCGEGVCGMCTTRLLDGVADHRDQILSADERARNAVIFPCVSRARSATLTLDV